MSWPLSQDYNEAIQDPTSAFNDPELRGGELKLNALGLPLPHSGNFADVYEVTCPATQTKWAVKCFTRQVPGLRERYSAVSRHLKDASLPFTVDFQFFEQGIRIHSQWYPILKMRWVEGLLFNELVRDNLDKPALLQALQQIWGRLARRLREADIAHADLQHGNVLLVPGRKADALAVKLIDYDGMWVPALAQTKSGEVGHPNYQHPQRLREGTYNREVDRFPFLVAATALRALTIAGRSLWERYDNGDNLLFKEADLRAPQESALFAELAGLSDAVVKKLVGRLRAACLARLEDAPLLEEVVPEEKATLQTAPPPLPPVASPITVAPVPATGWDFETGAADGSGEHPRPRKVSRKRAAGGGSGWTWVAAGGGIAVIAGTFVAVALLMGNGNVPPTNQVAFHTPAPTSANVAPPPSRALVPPTVAAVVPRPSAAVPATRPQQLEPDKHDPPPVGPEKHDPPPVGPVASRPLFRFLGTSSDLVAMAGDDTAVWEIYSSFQQRVVQRFVVAKPAPILAFDATPDGAFALTLCEDKRLVVWDTRTGKVVFNLPFKRRPIVAAALSADGRHVYTSMGGRTYAVWDIQQHTAENVNVNGTVSAIAVSPDGKRIALGLREEGAMPPRVAVAGIGGGEPREIGSHPAAITSLAFSPNGKRLASAGTDNAVRVWDLDSNELVSSFGEFRALVSRLQFSPNSGNLIAESALENFVWGQQSKKIISARRGLGEDQVTWAFDGRQLAFFSRDKADPKGTRGGMSISEPDVPETPPPVIATKGLYQMLPGRPDYVALTEGDSSIWKLQSAEKRDDLLRYKGHTRPIKCLSATASGQFAITGSEDKTAIVWEVDTGKVLARLEAHKGPVVAVALNAPATLALTADGGNEAILWDVPRATIIRRLQVPAAISALAISGDDKFGAFGYCFGGDKGGLQVRQLDGKGVVKQGPDLKAPISCVAFSPSSKVVIAACGGVQSLKFNHDDLQAQWFATIYTTPVHTITFGPDGDHFLMSAGRGYSLCSLAKAKEISNLVVAEGQTAAVLADGGRKVALVDLRKDGTMQRSSVDVSEVVGVAPPPPPPPDRPPKRPKGERFKVPGQDMIGFLQKQLREHPQFGPLYAKKGQALEEALSNLADHPVAGMVGAPDGRYVALREVLDMAIKRADAPGAVGYCKRIVDKYEVELVDVVGEALEKMLPNARDATTHKVIAEQALEVAEPYLKEENVPGLSRLLKVARTASKNVNDDALKERVNRAASEAHLKEEPVVAGGAKRTVPFAAIKKAVANNDIKEWETVGARFGNWTRPYKEIPPSGAILIGLNYTTTGNGNYPGAVQPIWLTAAGEVKGHAYGRAEPGATIHVVKAKPGYAVGAIYTRGGGGFDALQPIFMKIKDGGLDVDDKYEGTYIGGGGGNEGTFGGDGNFIVGIHGKLDPKKVDQMGCVSVITLTGKAAAP
jgi:WD40 repeat protein